LDRRACGYRKSGPGIRELYRDEERLPVMVVLAWTNVDNARKLERDRIYDCLQRQLPILNYERDMLGGQISLI
jgi:hypothetical protein